MPENISLISTEMILFETYSIQNRQLTIIRFILFFYITNTVHVQIYAETFSAWRIIYEKDFPSFISITHWLHIHIFVHPFKSDPEASSTRFHVVMAMDLLMSGHPRCIGCICPSSPHCYATLPMTVVIHESILGKEQRVPSGPTLYKV